MPGPAFLRGDDVTLTPVEREDVPFLQRLVNDPDVWAGIGAYAPKNAHQEGAWFERASEDEDAEHLLICVDSDADDGTDTDADADDGYESVGTIGLHDIDETWGGCELGYFVAPAYWNNGYATEAVTLVCEYAFAERRLNKVTAKALAHNSGSRRVLEKAGFTEEDVHREEAFVGGEYVGLVYYGLLAGEWRDDE